MTGGQDIRHSKADDASVLRDPKDIAKKEAENALRQADRVKEYVIESIDRGGIFRLRPSTILDLNRCAIDGLNRYAGNWRPSSVAINKSKHQPPECHMVPFLIEDLCDYVNENWECSSAIHLSAIVMWRLNWIHPFTDGNGRTSRAASYLILCAKEQMLLPGGYSIPEQIVEDRKPYYRALEDGDMNFQSQRELGPETVPKMEKLLASMLAKQLTNSHIAALK